jgi:membrane protein YdbS with pleckstrin-like domain
MVGEAIAESVAAASGGGHANRIDLWSVVSISLMLFWALGVGLAAIGLVRGERPYWPALVALILGLLPLAACLFSHGQGPAH